MSFQFKDLNIESVVPVYVGNNIDMETILDNPIRILYFKIEPSTKFIGTLFMTMQLEYEGKKRICFTRSKGLMETLRDRVPKDKFPLDTTITKVDRYLKFT